jgi:signal transduction histidine kinase
MSLYAFAFTGISAFILYLVLRRFVLNPVSALSGAMKKAADGDLSNRVSVTSQDEMGLLAGTYNTMAEELKVAREKMTLWTQSLEEEVAKKTYELRKSQDKLIQAEKLASLGRLTADVAHEIRNPLSAVGGFARRLHKIVTGDKEKEYASVVVSEVNRLERILRDILTFSRDARLHLEPQTIADVVHSAMHLYKNLCEDQSVHAVVTLPEDLPPVLIDKDQVVQALSNLVTNALEAMPYGGGGTLTVTAEMEEVYDVTFVVVRVADSGQGIREDHLPLIFEPFFSTKDIGRGSGTGLGLSITRKIMEEHGGFIRAESEPGKGSTFSLYFPYQAEDQAARTPCWEFMKCGRDRDASTKCPANPHFGRICWVVAGTFCEGKVQGTFAQKCEDCRKCEFYQKVQRKEL